MTSSSSAPIERGLDTMFLVYCVVQGHPAAAVTQQFLSTQTGWFTSPLVLFEAKATLTKIYGVDPAAASQKLTQFSAVPVAVLAVDAAGAMSAMQHGAGFMATEDQKFAQVCTQLGVTPQSPITPALRTQVAAWEAANQLPKGRQRMLHRVHQWLSQTHPQAAQDFWSKTGGGNHLP